MPISAAVGTIAINRKKSARRRPKLTLRKRILAPTRVEGCLRANVLSHTRGAIAQLGERLDRTQEVAGSSPASSMKLSATEQIDNRIAELGDWRAETLTRVRELIHDADPKVVEEFKWAKQTSPGTPVWEHDGIICTGESYKDKVKLTFAKGASLKDPAKLFNSSLDGNTRRAIDIHEGEEIDADAFKTLVLAAVALNTA